MVSRIRGSFLLLIILAGTLSIAFLEILHSPLLNEFLPVDNQNYSVADDEQRLKFPDSKKQKPVSTRRSLPVISLTPVDPNLTIMLREGLELFDDN